MASKSRGERYIELLQIVQLLMLVQLLISKMEVNVFNSNLVVPKCKSTVEFHQNLVVN